MEFKKFWWLWLILGIGLIILILSMIGSTNDKTANPLDSDKIITSSPVNVDQIYSISKYRSCAGHEYSGINFNGESEPSSSMKQYFAPILSLLDSDDKVEVYAPFDGKIVRIDPADIQRGRQFIIEHEPFNGWYITFDHINISDKIKEGAEVKSGEFLGYADVLESHQSGVHDFDIILQRFSKQYTDYGNSFQNLEPIFPHMTDSVLQQFTTKGLIIEDTVISKSYRSSNPCKCAVKNPDNGFCQQFKEANKSDWVVINGNSSENPDNRYMVMQQ